MLHGTMRVLLLVATLCASASAGPPLNSPLPERRYPDGSSPAPPPPPPPMRSNPWASCDSNALVCCLGPCCSRVSGQTVATGSNTQLYGNDETCQWRIRSSSSFTLSFVRFNTEATKDWVKIYECQDAMMESCSTVASWSGDQSGRTDTWSSPGSGIMKVKFTSDAAGTRTGFEAVITGEAPCTTSDFTATDFDCSCDTYSPNTNECTAGNFCWHDKTCNNAAKQATRCTTSDFTATGANCRCEEISMTNECFAGNFCWVDKTCHSRAKNRAKMSTGAVIGIVAGVWFAVCWICPLPFLALKTWN